MAEMDSTQAGLTDDQMRAVMRKVGELRHEDRVPFEWQVEFIDAYAVMRQQRLELEALQQKACDLESSEKALRAQLATKELLVQSLRKDAERYSITGEQLYMLVTSRFKGGFFPWKMVATPEAWNEAAALLSIDSADLADAVMLRKS